MELTSLVVKNEVFKQVEFKDIRCKVLDAKQIYNLTKLLKRKHNQVQEIEKYRCQLVMNGSTAVVGHHILDTYSPVIDFPSLRLLKSLAYISSIYQCSSRRTNLCSVSNMPDDVIFGFKGGNYALLLQNLYGLKTAPKLW